MTEFYDQERENIMYLPRRGKSYGEQEAAELSRQRVRMRRRLLAWAAVPTIAACVCLMYLCTLENPGDGWIALCFVACIPFLAVLTD